MCIFAYTEIQFLLHREHFVHDKTILKMLFKQIIVFRWDSNVKTHKYTVWQNSGLVNIVTCGAYRYHGDITDHRP
jgi:hypothetical protein